MKITGFAFLLTALAAHGDILSDTLPFMGSPNPQYSPEDLEPELALEYPQYAPISPADSDFGVQQVLGETPDRAPVNFVLSMDLHYTDNAPAEAPAQQDGSYLISSLLGASWRPHLVKGWFADMGFTQEFYDFDNGDATDFENMQAYIGIAKNLVDLDDTVFFTRYEYQRLTTGSISDSDYSAQRIRTGLQKNLYLSPHQQLAGGISAAFDIDANSEDFERKEYAVEFSYTYIITDALSATATARHAIWKFDNGGRKDRNTLAGIELAYRLCENASLYSSVYYTKNASNALFGVNDSQSWQTGLGLGIKYSF